MYSLLNPSQLFQQYITLRCTQFTKSDDEKYPHHILGAQNHCAGIYCCNLLTVNTRKCRDFYFPN